MLRALDLTRKFGDSVAVDGLSFEVPNGSVFALLGPNGAGKTTTVRMLTCLIRPTSGTAQFDGLDVAREADAMQVRAQVGLLPESPGLYERLSAFKNLDFHARLYGVPQARRASNIERLLRLLGVWERRDDPVNTFSKGMRQKIAIARALVHDPNYLFLDEPTASLDPEASRTVREFILGLKAEGRTVFLNTHNLDEAERVATRIGILNHKLMAVGTPDELRARVGPPLIVAQLVGPAAPFVAHLEHEGLRVVGAEGTTVRVAAANGDTAPRLAEALVRAGGKVLRIEQEKPTLESVYLALMGEST